ncbi:unnamed protein product [marine sediment metagenome]|uniref:Uncharacterized protein n=1 Tax=marine sediment metagenome TaxID=412755 RepID=X1AQ03_9ZZZZ
MNHYYYKNKQSSSQIFPKISPHLKFCTVNRKIHFNSSYLGNVHVSQISNKYVEKIKDAFQKTDIVRGKVINLKYTEYDLNTTGKNLGVIHSDCVICGTALNKIGFNKLRCPLCGNIESRKLFNDYRNITYNLRY